MSEEAKQTAVVQWYRNTISKFIKNPFQTSLDAKLAEVELSLRTISARVAQNAMNLSKEEIKKIGEEYLKNPKPWARLVEVAKTSGSPSFKDTIITVARQFKLPCQGLYLGSVIELTGTDYEIATIDNPLNIDATGLITTGPSFSIETKLDSNFSVKFGESQIPSAYRIEINSSGADGDFIIDGSAPSGWNLLTARKINPIPRGVTGRVSIFLQPQPGTSIPAVGTSVPFSITVTRANESGSALTQNLTFVVPEIRSLKTVTESKNLYSAPNGTAQAEVTFANTGNVVQTINIGLSLVNGISASGLQSPITLSPSASVTQNINFAIPNLPLNSTYPCILGVS